MNHDKDIITTKHQIYKALRREIITGRKRPGERLAVNAIVAIFGTSVTPVRDALQMLSQEGLVAIKPRSGYFVIQVTLKELRDMFELREILETAAVELAARQITADQIKALRHVHVGYTGDDDDSYDRYTDENRQFHYLVARASGNFELAQMIRHLHDRLARFMVIRHAGKRLPEIHARLIENLEDHNVAGAIKSIRKELRDTRLTIMEHIMQEEGANWSLGSYVEQ